MTFKDFVKIHKNDNICPLFPSINDFNEVWYTTLADTVSFPQISNMHLMKYATLHMIVGYYYDGNYDDYFERYKSFINSINEPMKHLYKLISIDYNPYENVEKHGDITTTFSGSDTTNNSFGEIVNSTIYGATTTTQNNGEKKTISNNKTASYEGINVDSSNNDTTINASEDTVSNSEHTDTNTINEHTDTSTMNYGKIEKVVDNTHGNIGVTSAMELGNQELKYAPLLNLAKLFLSLYRDEFGGYLYEN